MGSGARRRGRRKWLGRSRGRVHALSLGDGGLRLRRGCRAPRLLTVISGSTFCRLAAAVIIITIITIAIVVIVFCDSNLERLAVLESIRIGRELDPDAVRCFVAEIGGNVPGKRAIGIVDALWVTVSLQRDHLQHSARGKKHGHTGNWLGNRI